MKTIEVYASILPKGNYALHVVERGHIPGVLSGAELSGKAAQYSSWYCRKRADVVNVLRRYGIIPSYDLGAKGRPLVWHHEGEPVQLKILYTGK